MQYHNFPISALYAVLFCFCLLFFGACGPPANVPPAPNGEVAATDAAPAEMAVEELDPGLLEKLRNEKWTGDLDELVRRRYIRALVFYNKTSFFYDGPQARGISYESLVEFEKFLNRKLNTGKTPVYVVFIPVSRDEAIKRMADGRGDILVSNIPIIPELQTVMDFSDPVRTDAKEVVVTGPSAASPIVTLDDLSGKEVFVRRTSRYWLNLERLNKQFEDAGKPKMSLRAADDDLEDEDILEMVNAGLAGMTVMDDMAAGLWSQILPDIQVHNDIQLTAGDQIGWAVQKNTPAFLGLVNDFVREHKLGTSFGNTLVQRYIKDPKWARNNTRPEEMEKFRSAIAFFKKYGGEYNFDWLMIAAQAYQESGIDQSRRSPAGAVGVMQIKPSTAEDKAIGISGVETDMEKNINAGVKYLDHISKQFFQDSAMNKVNRGLFAFAAYNAGPARIAGLRKKAEQQGLDPNIWFNNVEIVAARDIGAETVTYVSNIYKYYTAYKMVTEGNARRQRK